MTNNELSLAQVSAWNVFEDASSARAWLEANLWTNGPVCGHCRTANRATPIRNRVGLYQCNACRKQFTVTVGTSLEHSHVPLNKWLLAARLLSDPVQPTSTYQLHRKLDVSYKTASLMALRLKDVIGNGEFPIPHGNEVIGIPKIKRAARQKPPKTR